MSEINPLMVTLARESRGYTQTALAEKMRVGQGTLSKIENGQTSPSDDILARLGEALDYPASLFLEPLTFRNLPPSFYRKRANTPVGTLRMIRAKVNLLRRQLEKLLRSVDLPECLLPTVDLESRKQSVERIAQELRLRWHVPPGPVENLTATIEAAGIVVARCDFGNCGVDAVNLYEPQDALPPMVFVSDCSAGDRLRYSMAHELGHLVLHRHEALSSRDIEAEANRFASEFLMPAADIRGHLLRVNLDKLANMKPHWRVSMGSLLERAFQLGRITERQRRHLWVQMSRRGYRVTEPFPVPPEEPGVMREMVRIHLDELGYGERDLCDLVRLNLSEFRSQYLSGGPTLRVIRGARDS